jgi:SmpA / OmlA family
MTARKLRGTVAGLVVVVIVGGAFALWPRDERATRENFDRVQDHMTRAEVEAILGSPALQYPGESRNWGSVFACGAVLPPPAAFTLEWDNDRDTFSVSFDESGRAAGCYSCALEVDRPPLEKLRWRLHCLRQRWFPAKEDG